MANWIDILSKTVLDSKDPNDEDSVISKSALNDDVIEDDRDAEKENNEIALEGHLFEEDGVYIGQWGKNVDDCFSIKKGAWRTEEKNGKKTLYYKDDNLIKLYDINGKSIKLDTLLKFASIVYDESGGSVEFYEETILALAWAIRNFILMHNVFYSDKLINFWDIAEKKSKSYAYGKNDWIKKPDNKLNKYVYTIGAAIKSILGVGGDASHSAVKWDGADLAWKGYNQDKPKNDGIDFKEEPFNQFKNFYSKQRIKKYTGLDKEFPATFSSGKYIATGNNKGRVLHLAGKFIGNSVFWIPNYNAEENEAQYQTENGKSKMTMQKYNFKHYFYYG